MRIALVYDRLYPHTIGGLERYFAALAEALADRNTVTYLTRELWDRPESRSFDVVGVSPGGSFYRRSGRRRVWPALRFGFGVFGHLVRHHDYDVVHISSFPWLALLGARLALRVCRSSALLVVDWLELWPKSYWIDYAGPLLGRVGYAVQERCLRVEQVAVTHSALTEHRLRRAGYHGSLLRLLGLFEDRQAGLYDDRPTGNHKPTEAGPGAAVVFAGRHVPEKQVALVPEVIRRAREWVPSLSCTIYGDGPETAAVHAEVQRLALEQVVHVAGVASDSELSAAFRQAACLLHPSLREGFGLVIVEAAAAGTPSVVIDSSENAALELVIPGVNGEIVDRGDIDGLAAAVAKLVQERDVMKPRTRAWYEANAESFDVRNAADALQRVYAEGLAGPIAITEPVEASISG